LRSQGLSDLHPGKMLSHGPLLMDPGAVHQEELKRIEFGFPEGGGLSSKGFAPPVTH
jgi:hypothetical protein